LIETHAGSTTRDHHLAEALRNHNALQARSLSEQHILQNAERVPEALARGRPADGIGSVRLT